MKPRERIRMTNLIIPVSRCPHLVLINGILFLLPPQTYLDLFNLLYYNIAWLLITSFLHYHRTTRKERFTTTINKMFQLYLIFGLAYFSLFTFRGRLNISIEYQAFVSGTLCLTSTCHRWFFYWSMRKYRLKGGNYVNVVAIGRDSNLKRIRRVLNDPYLGYRYKGFFDDSPALSPTYLGKLKLVLGTFLTIMSMRYIVMLPNSQNKNYIL